MGTLNYIMSRTRPDIAAAVRAVGEHLTHPSMTAWAAVQRIFSYLNKTAHYTLRYSKGDSMTVNAFTDADWGSCVNSRRSITGSLVYMGKNLVMWCCHKQDTVALSTTEAEYMSLSECTKEIMWLRQLLGELHFKQPHATTIYEDNAGCIKLANNEIILSRSKHIDIKHHFLREKILKRVINPVYVSTHVNTADIMTKGLSVVKFQEHVTNLELYSGRSLVSGKALEKIYIKVY